MNPARNPGNHLLGQAVGCKQSSEISDILGRHIDVGSLLQLRFHLFVVGEDFQQTSAIDLVGLVAVAVQLMSVQDVAGAYPFYHLIVEPERNGGSLNQDQVLFLQPLQKTPEGYSEQLKVRIFHTPSKSSCTATVMLSLCKSIP